MRTHLLAGLYLFILSVAIHGQTDSLAIEARRNYDNGNFRYEKPMFWIDYPEAREILAREKVFNYGNDASPLTWEDQLERRFFSSYIFKESNVHDRRLQEYLSGVDLLLEADKIKNEIFNFENDLWTY